MVRGIFSNPPPKNTSAFRGTGHIINLAGDFIKKINEKIADFADFFAFSSRSHAPAWE